MLPYATRGGFHLLGKPRNRRVAYSKSAIFSMLPYATLCYPF